MNNQEEKKQEPEPQNDDDDIDLDEFAELLKCANPMVFALKMLSNPDMLKGYVKVLEKVKKKVEDITNDLPK